LAEKKRSVPMYLMLLRQHLGMKENKTKLPIGRIDIKHALVSNEIFRCLNGHYQAYLNEDASFFSRKQCLENLFAHQISQIQ